MLERMEPGTLARWLIVAALVYLILPYDLIPDFFGLPGRIDDLLMMGWLAWLYRTRMGRSFASGSAGSPGDGRKRARGRSRAERGPSDGSSSRSSRDTRRDGSASSGEDAYQVLGVDRTASQEAIRAAYRSRMKEYHPDKVAHLGSELQDLAHAKSQQIERAYRRLRRK